MTKKIASIIAAALMLALLAPTAAFAAVPRNQQWTGGAGACLGNAAQSCLNVARGYVDADGDGICDNFAQRDGSARGYTDADGDGVCDNRPNAGGRGTGYIDADGDGVCDNFSNPSGRGAGYIDADGDGVCDNAYIDRGQGFRHGWGHRR